MRPACRVLAVQVLPENRRHILADLLTVYANAGKTIVFTQTRREADEVAAGIAGVIPSEVSPATQASLVLLLPLLGVLLHICVLPSCPSLPSWCVCPGFV